MNEECACQDSECGWRGSINDLISILRWDCCPVCHSPDIDYFEDEEKEDEDN